MNFFHALAVASGVLCAESLAAADPIALPLPQPKVEFVVINTERVDYLQSEFSGLVEGNGVVLDSISIRRQERGLYEKGVSLEVHWRWAQAGRDSVFPAVRRVQFLDSLPLTLDFAPVGAIVRMVAKVDTLWTCNAGQCLIAATPRVVQNYVARNVVCAIACVQEDSASVAAKVREKLEASGIVVGLKPSGTARPIARVWRQATGEEQWTGICEKLPGNLGNWIAPDQARFDVSTFVYAQAKKVGLPWGIDYSTGPVQYMYDRTADPSLKILEGAGPRVVNDTLVKIGRSLSLSGNTKRVCGRVINDSAVAKDSWFVVPDSGHVEAVDRALSPGFCGQRNSAWRLTGDTVWLGNDRWPVLVQDLLGTSAIEGKKGKSEARNAARLVGSRLDLPWAALVAARDLSGHRLGRALVRDAGLHELELAGHRGAFLLEVRRLGESHSMMYRGTSIGR